MLKYKSNKIETGISLQSLQKQELIIENRIQNVMIAVKRREKLDMFFRIWISYIHMIKFRKEIVAFCKRLRERNVKEKVIGTWKHLISTDGIENRFKRKYEMDLNSYKEEYLEMIALLQTNIKQTDDEIYTRRLARKEFSFNLSRNLLKTISNLSMDVVSLNQYSIKDKETSADLDLMNQTIKAKLKELDKVKLIVQVEEDVVEEVQQTKGTGSKTFTSQQQISSQMM